MVRIDDLTSLFNNNLDTQLFKLPPRSQIAPSVAFNYLKMRLYTWILVASITPVSAFVPSVAVKKPAAFRLSSSTDAEAATTITEEKKQKYLGLLTFDLDDSLYPLEKVINEANEAFVRAMNNYGFTDITPWSIDSTGRRIRKEMAKTDPEGAAVLTHTEIRLLAIREEMERIILDRKLKATAEDWATDVNSLTHIVVKSARQ